MTAAAPVPAVTAAYIGLGGNLGDALAQVADALQQLAEHPAVQTLQASSYYRSAPVDATGPDFINAVARVETDLAPHALLDLLQALEHGAGRERPYRNAPRTLDLDLLLYGEQRIDDARLTVPHPRLHQRAFVLQPLAELAPALVIPGLGPLQAFGPGVADQAVERLSHPIFPTR